jgi:hypothetical protein
LAARLVARCRGRSPATARTPCVPGVDPGDPAGPGAPPGLVDRVDGAEPD